ncbi:NUDIX hydrolase [Sulfolobus acidocaldarius SUSAZ]|nr:NUDIX hydrolase [Sulfolobus acidocaldarius SUSAZ]
MRIYSSKKFDVLIENFNLPNGKQVEKAFVKHRGSVVIAPFLEPNRIILIKQYRPILGKWLYELPAGTIEEGENEDLTARRELEEEIGYVPLKLFKVLKFYVSPGIATELMHLYIATNLTKSTQKLEEYEVIEPFELSIDEAIKMIDEGKIEDGKTILSLLFISRKYQEIRSLLQG